MSLTSLLAEAEPANLGLISYGGIGILALALLLAVRELWAREKANADQLRAQEKLNADQLLKRAEKAEAEVARLNAEIQNSTLPAVVKATEVMGQLLAKTRQRGPS